MKKTAKHRAPLMLNKETLRHIEDRALDKVGGAGVTDNPNVSFCVCPTKARCKTIGEFC